MKQVSNNYKNNIKKFGKQLDSIVTYTQNNSTVTLDNTQLNAITCRYNGAILKSIMKELIIDSNVEIPLNTILNYQFGVFTGEQYEYIDYGNYIVYKVEKKEDTNSYEITCYDKMLYSMVKYEALSITYPITIRNYLSAICTKLGLTFANSGSTFANYNREIPNELYLNSDNQDIGYTFRDVLDEIAQATGSTICINNNDQLELRYIGNSTVATINEQSLKDVNVNFGTKYGPINSIVLARASDSDSVYLQDAESIAQNGLCELKISENQIMNGNDRSDYLPDLLQQLDGLEYYLNDYTSPGITYLELCDRYNVQIGSNTYSCVMFNDEINVTQGLEEIVHTELLEQSETDYTKADKTDRKINQTTLIVDKHEQEIQALINKVVDISNIVDGVGTVTLENAHEGILHKIEMIGSISLLFPSTQTHYGRSLMISDDLIVNNDTYISSGVPYQNSATYPSATQYPKSSNIIVDEDIYNLDFDYLNYLSPSVHDKYVYEDGKQWIERNVGIDAQGNMYALGETIIENKSDIYINVKANSTITLETFGNGVLQVEYLLENKYTENFATQVYVDSSIKQTTDEIEAKVSSVSDTQGNITSASIKLALNQDESEIKIQGDQIALEGTVTANEGFIIDKYGNMTCKNGTFTDGTIELYGDQYNYNFKATDNDKREVVIGGGWLGVNRDIIKTEEEHSYVDFHISTYNENDLDDTYPYTKIGSEIRTFSGGGGTSQQLWQIEANEEYTNLGLYGTEPIWMTTSDGSIHATSFINTSTKEKKKNIEKLKNALDIIKSAEVYSYNWQSEEDTRDKKSGVKKHYGLVIGDKYKTPKEFIHNDKDGKEDGIDIYATLSFCIKAIQEQQEQIEELQKEIKTLKEEKDGKDKLSK